MATFLQSVVAAFNKDAAAVSLVSSLAAKAVRRAYTAEGSPVIDIQVMLDHMTKSYRDALPRFFRKAGINIVVEPGKPAIVGGVLDRSKQGKVFEWLSSEPQVIDVEDVIRAPKKVKAPEGTVAQQADAAIAALVKRVKNDKSNPLGGDVAAIINTRLNQAPEVVEVVATWTLVGGDAESVTDLTAEDYMLVMAFLNKRRAALADMNYASVEKLAKAA